MRPHEGAGASNGLQEPAEIGAEPTADAKCNANDCFKNSTPEDETCSDSGVIGITTTSDVEFAKVMQLAENERTGRRRGPYSMQFVMGPVQGPRPEFDGLAPLTRREEKDVTALLTGERKRLHGDECLCFIAATNAILRRSDMPTTRRVVAL